MAPSRVRQPDASRRLLVSCSYDFASAGNTRVPGFRKNRNVEKRKAKDLDNVVRGLTQMTGKQLLAVAHLLRPAPGIMDDIAIAAKLPRSNQGRKRQEDLVAKKIRESIDSDALSKLADAVALAESTQALYEDSDIQNMMETWKEQLLAGDQAGFQDVLTQASEANVDLSPQQLGQLVRQLQQCIREEQEEVAAAAAAAAATASTSEPGGGSSGEEEDGASSSSGTSTSTPAQGSAVSQAAGTATQQPAGSSSGLGVTGSAGIVDDEAASLAAELGGLVPRPKASKKGSRMAGNATKQGEGVRSTRQTRQIAENALTKVLKKIAEVQVLNL